jgi:hypothetical protein
MDVRFFLGAATIALIALTGCGRTVQGGTERSASTVPGGALEEVAARFQRSPQVVIAKVGQVLAIAPPDATRRWQLDYSSDILEALTPRHDMQRPDKAWRFRASRAGEADVRVSAIEDPGSPAPPAPIQYLITVRVTP